MRSAPQALGWEVWSQRARETWMWRNQSPKQQRPRSPVSSGAPCACTHLSNLIFDTVGRLALGNHVDFLSIGSDRSVPLDPIRTLSRHVSRTELTRSISSFSFFRPSRSDGAPRATRIRSHTPTRSNRSRPASITKAHPTRDRNITGGRASAEVSGADNNSCGRRELCYTGAFGFGSSSDIRKYLVSL
jgi:hypothetical protein